MRLHALVSFLSPQPIIDVQDVVVIIIIVPVVVRRLTRFSKNSPGIMRRFVSKLRVADVIRVQYIGGQLAQGLWKENIFIRKT